VRHLIHQILHKLKPVVLLYEFLSDKIAQVIYVRVERIAPDSGVRVRIYRRREVVHQALFLSGTAETSQNKSGSNGEAAVFRYIA